MKILFFGVTQFATKGLKTILKLNHEVVGIIIGTVPNQDTDTIKLIAQENNIPIYAFEKINEPHVISLIKNELQPDLILTFTYPQKLSKELYSLAENAINFHPAFLPYYRGNNPYFWTIANGEKFTGVTFHHLNEEFDMGDIIFQEKVPISEFDTCGMVIAKQEVVALKLFENILEKLEKKEPLPKISQAAGDYPRAPKPILKDYFIEWSWNSKKILDRIRALNPYSGAYTQYKNTVLGVYSASYSKFTSTEKIGTVVGLTTEGPLVKCSDGAIILKILVVGKKYLLSGNDFLEYEKVKVGDRFFTW